MLFILTGGIETGWYLIILLVERSYDFDKYHKPTLKDKHNKMKYGDKKQHRIDFIKRLLTSISVIVS